MVIYIPYVFLPLAFQVDMILYAQCFRPRNPQLLIFEKLFSSCPIQGSRVLATEVGKNPFTILYLCLEAPHGLCSGISDGNFGDFACAMQDPRRGYYESDIYFGQNSIECLALAGLRPISGSRVFSSHHRNIGILENDTVQLNCDYIVLN